MKKTVKTLFIILLALIVFTSAFVGCKKKGEAKSEEKIIVKAMGYGDNSNQEGLNWKRIVEAFEKENPNIDIQDELLYDEAYHQKVVARLAAGDIPDFAYMGADARWGAPWAEAGQQLSQKDLIDANYYDMKLIPEMGPNGEIYYVPLGTSNITTVLFMNKTLVESLGFSQPETYEDLVAMVPAAKAAGVDVVSIDGADGWAWGSCLLSVLIARTSGDPMWISKAVAGENKFTDKAFVDALSLISMMIDDGVISEKAVLIEYGTNISNFSNGKALFMVQGQWAAGGVENPDVEKSMVLMAWPRMPGEKSATAGSVAAAWQVGYGLTKSGASNPAVKDAAVKFIKYFNSHPEVTQRLRDGAIVAPVLKNFVVPDDLPNGVKQKVGLAQMALNTEVVDSFLTGAPNDALNAGMQKIASRQATAEEIAAEVEALVRK